MHFLCYPFCHSVFKYLYLLCNDNFFCIFSFHAGPILESRGMHAIFQKKDKVRAKNVLKRQKRAKFGQKCTEFEDILKKGM